MKHGLSVEFGEGHGTAWQRERQRAMSWYHMRDNAIIRPGAARGVPIARAALRLLKLAGQPQAAVSTAAGGRSA